MIEALELSKAYGKRRVLDRASISAAPGECVVLTGDNGSGKTTLLHILVGLRRPDEGEILWRGERLTGARLTEWRKAREEWGFLPQRVNFPTGATVEQLLDHHTRLRRTGQGPAYEWIERVGLEESVRQRVSALSGGMQQRLGIALTLFFGPKLVVMDEPASSLDPDWRSELADWANEVAEGGAAVLVTSQIHELWGPNARYQHCEGGRVVEGVIG